MLSPRIPEAADSRQTLVRNVGHAVSELGLCSEQEPETLTIVFLSIENNKIITWRKKYHCQIAFNLPDITLKVSRRNK